jgi:hypothetical protein
LAVSFDRPLAPNASLIVDTAGSQTAPVVVGSANLTATTAKMDGFAIFHLIPGAQEAVVPVETRNAPFYLLPFDNTGGVTLGIAIENVIAQAANVAIVIRDDTGVQLATDSIPMSANGHTSFLLSMRYLINGKQARHHRVRYATKWKDQRSGHPGYAFGFHSHANDRSCPCR